MLHRLVWPAALLALTAACDSKLDEVRVKKATGILRGWDRSTCYCDMTVDAWGAVNASFACNPVFDGKNGFSGMLNIEEQPYNIPVRAGVWNYEGVGGVAWVEFTDETVIAGPYDHGYRAVFIDQLYIPSQDACQDHIGGYYDYYIYETCEAIDEGLIEGMAMWCRDDRVTGGSL